VPACRDVCLLLAQGSGDPTRVPLDHSTGRTREEHRRDVPHCGRPSCPPRSARLVASVCSSRAGDVVLPLAPCGACEDGSSGVPFPPNYGWAWVAQLGGFLYKTSSLPWCGRPAAAPLEPTAPDPAPSGGTGNRQIA
jgi:hypothetical protein